MAKTALHTFLTDESIRLHKEYMKDQKLRYSILVKSIPELKGKTLSEVHKLQIKRSVKQEALELLSDIAAHEVYFNSFVDAPVPCKALKKHFSSEAGFAFELLTLAKKHKEGFIYINDRGSSRPHIVHSFELPILQNIPTLALDICEHAYFLDYRFERDEYLRRAISHLDLSKIAPTNT